MKVNSIPKYLWVADIEKYFSVIDLSGGKIRQLIPAQRELFVFQNLSIPFDLLILLRWRAHQKIT